MTASPTLAIVIINYKTPDMTIDCLSSLLPELQGKNYQVIVVDNHSLDDSVQRIQQWIDNTETKQVTLVASDHNGGFAAGNNIGISAVAAEHYLLLNSDTLVRAGAITMLLETLVNNPGTGLIGPRLEWPDGSPQESCFNQHSPVSEFVHAAKTGPLSRLLKKFVVAKPVQNTQSESGWISFACVMIRQPVIEQIGLLDEGFFMYFEDAAFCHRAKKAGWKILNNPSAHVVHLRGGSSPVKSQLQQRKRLPKYYFESRTRYFYLLYGRAGLFAANILWSVGAMISFFRGLISSSYTPDIAKYQWLDIWTNFLKPLKQYTHPDDYSKT